VLFEETLEASVTSAQRWPALRGLSAPTLLGTVPARIARVPVIEIDGARSALRADGVDVGVLQSDLSQVLSRVTRETIHGLIGYSFLKRYRVALDYPNRVLWLDPIPGYKDDRPLEYCHVGLQLERQDGAVVVMGVVEGSPAAQAGIARGDQVVALDGMSADTIDLLALTRRMEGEPGRALTLVMRRDAVDRTVRLVRRRLL
jgi:S1-C subfamily serine protease